MGRENSIRVARKRRVDQIEKLNPFFRMGVTTLPHFEVYHTTYVHFLFIPSEEKSFTTKKVYFMIFHAFLRE